MADTTTSVVIPGNSVIRMNFEFPSDFTDFYIIEVHNEDKSLIVRMIFGTGMEPTRVFIVENGVETREEIADLDFVIDVDLHYTIFLTITIYLYEMKTSTILLETLTILI